MTSAKGFSLLEVLAALALLAILLLGVYSGIRMTTTSVSRGTSAIEHLDEVRGARDFLRRELASATALPWKLGEGEKPIVFDGDAKTLRFVAPLPGYLGKLGAQVVSLSLAEDKEDKGHKQRLEVAFAALPTSAGTMPAIAPESLLAEAEGMYFRYAGPDGAWHDAWPNGTTLPTSIMIDRTFASGQRDPAWPTLVVAIHEDPDAINPGDVARSLLFEGGR